MWNELEPLQQHLPDNDVVWPHSGFCLHVEPSGITKGRHTLCTDQGYTDNESLIWNEHFGWNLNGILVFQLNEKHFQVVPLVAAISNKQIVLPEVQLAFDRVEGGWTWQKSQLGPINACFHEVHIRRMEEEGKAGTEENINWLGNVVSLCLGTLYEKLNDPMTSYDIVEPKAAKMKMKGERVVKIYRHATVGHVQII